PLGPRRCWRRPHHIDDASAYPRPGGRRTTHDAERPAPRRRRSFAQLSPERDMQRVMVRYTVKPDRAAENERYIQQVFAELARSAPPGMQYAAFKLNDGVSFAPLYAHDTGSIEPLRALSAFQEFRA